jgi:hypothetical protein
VGGLLFHQPQNTKDNQMKLNELLEQITPLPWRYAELDNDKLIPTVRLFGRRRSKSATEVCLGRLDLATDACYACHAANVLPDLVEALAILLTDQQRPKSELSRGQFEFCKTALNRAQIINLKGAS